MNIRGTGGDRSDEGQVSIVRGSDRRRTLHAYLGRPESPSFVDERIDKIAGGLVPPAYHRRIEIPVDHEGDLVARSIAADAISYDAKSIKVAAVRLEKLCVGLVRERRGRASPAFRSDARTSALETPPE